MQETKKTPEESIQRSLDQITAELAALRSVIEQAGVDLQKLFGALSATITASIDRGSKQIAAQAQPKRTRTASKSTDDRKSNCRNCGKEIVWAAIADGRKRPFDPEDSGGPGGWVIEDGIGREDSGGKLSFHFETCDKAPQKNNPPSQQQSQSRFDEVPPVEDLPF